jgi:hypothetical protein
MTRLRDLSPATKLVLLVCFSLVLATYVWWPMIHAYPKTADLDGRYFLHQWAAGKAAIRNHHEFPLWNPFDCKGVPMWSHPESMTGSPLLLLCTWFSPTITLCIWNIVHCAAGFVSMWLLARVEVGMSRVAAFLAAATWAFSVCHLSQYAGAHSSLSDFWLAPLFVYLWRRAERDRVYVVKLGALIAFAIYEGATYPLPFIIAILILETLTRVTPISRLPRIALSGALVGVVAVGLSAARLFPLVSEMMSKKRGNMLPDIDDLARFHTLSEMYLWREGHWWQRLPNQQYVWGEYIAYVGPIGLALAVIGIVMSLRDRKWVVALAFLTLLMMLGHFSGIAPWQLINRHVFPYTSMRVPSRFRLILQMFVSLGIATAVDRAPQWLGRARVDRTAAKSIQALMIGAAFFAAGDAAGLGMDIIEWMHQGPPEQTVERSSHFYYGGPGLAEWLDQPKQDRSWLGCRSFEWPANGDAPVWVGDLPQAKSAEGTGIVVRNVTRTQNTFTFDVEAAQPGRVFVNSAHASGWRSNVGSVVDDRTLLALDVPAGTHHVKMRYWPKMLTPGIAVTAVTIVGLLGVGLFLRRRKRPTTSS